MAEHSRLMSGHFHIAMQIEADRIKAGISQEALFLQVGITARTWRRWIALARPVPSEIERRIRRVLDGELQIEDLGMQRVRQVYTAAVAQVVGFYSVSVDDVRAADPRFGATENDLWRRSRHAHQAAVYIANTVLGVPQRRLAEALALTPAAICLALKSVEDRRREPAFDQAMREAYRAITWRDE